MEEEQTRTQNAEEESIDITKHVTDFLDTYSQYIIVNVAQKTANLSSSFIISIAIGFFLSLIILFLGMGLAWWLGELVNNHAAGFFMVGGFFLLCMLILVALRKKIIFPFLRNFITRKFYE